ncbi:hypothetical protein [Thalassovita mediterranea]|jgi:hypothetical protein|uniref:Uncharacterized protein n=1 Tax=Thalassovita mediterranea TaxID=340021 RepID=A0A0P1GM69_9RHOB|nr:hypothetical protein [Thalassovita mediterranea]CUH83405.1 hypothetical protein TM5383_00593 [Thalassovita mediterranea]CUH83486.1 hypothetical protein TM5383_00676 [Thalassovita mediterranea]SIS35598.1 hypothetical protein SAMN05421685_1189 [Thalassovita mediterranea]SIS35726.1 hypothetical protein SAMN05421685_1244 [Thalassovita mediterranea]
MNRIVTASAAALIALTGAASAMTSDVSGYDAAQIRQFAPNIDLSLVDADAVKKAASVIENLEDDDASFAQIQNSVRHVLTK